MTNALALTVKSKKQRDNINATKNFDYTTIADRFSTVSWSNSSSPTGVVKPVYDHSTIPTNRNSRVIKRKDTHWTICK